MVSPGLTQQQSKDELACDVALDLIAAYRRKGAKIIIFDHLFTDPILLDSFIERSGCLTRVFYLSASPDVLKSRIQKRGRPQVDWEITQTAKVENLQRTALSGGSLGTEIKTDDLSPEQVVERIKNLL
jgi:hypothetical protein